jgi:hypothetical protein
VKARNGPGFSSFWMGGFSSSARSGRAISGTGCMVLLSVCH